MGLGIRLSEVRKSTRRFGRWKTYFYLLIICPDPTAEPLQKWRSEQGLGEQFETISDLKWIQCFSAPDLQVATLKSQKAHISDDADSCLEMNRPYTRSSTGESPRTTRIRSKTVARAVRRFKQLLPCLETFQRRSEEAIRQSTRHRSARPSAYSSSSRFPGAQQQTNQGFALEDVTNAKPAHKPHGKGHNHGTEKTENASSELFSKTLKKSSYKLTSE